MFRGEDRPKIMRVDLGVVAIPLFRIEVPASGEEVGFGSKFTRSESDNQIELRQELRP